MSIARNLCRDAWKRSRRHRELLEERVAEGRSKASAVSTATFGPVPGMGSPTGTGSTAETPDLRAALARLPEGHRLPLLLYYFDGYSTARVGEALGISATGARARLCRARRALREVLEVDRV